MMIHMNRPAAGKPSRATAKRGLCGRRLLRLAWLWLGGRGLRRLLGWLLSGPAGQHGRGH
jgi:hypothetical protein